MTTTPHNATYKLAGAKAECGQIRLSVVTPGGSQHKVWSSDLRAEPFKNASALARLTEFYESRIEKKQPAGRKRLHEGGEA